MSKKLSSMLVGAIIVLAMMPVGVLADDTLEVVKLDGTVIEACDDVIEISEPGDYVVSGTSTSKRIAVTSRCDITRIILQNVNIDVSRIQNAAAIDIIGENHLDSQVEIVISGICTLISGENCAGIQKRSTNLGFLFVSGDGKLIAKGGANGAGIGSGDGEGIWNLKISTKIVEAYGGANAAAIGGGKNGCASALGLTNTYCTAVGGVNAAAIGGGVNRGATVSVLNSEISAIAGENASAIGSGYDSLGLNNYSSNINIHNSTIDAFGKEFGIGGVAISKVKITDSYINSSGRSAFGGSVTVKINPKGDHYNYKIFHTAPQIGGKLSKLTDKINLEGKLPRDISYASQVIIYKEQIQ